MPSKDTPREETCATPPPKSRPSLGIAAEVRVDNDRGLMWVLGDPWDLVSPLVDAEESELLHNCDAMGCSSAGLHVLAIVRTGPEEAGS